MKNAIEANTNAEANTANEIWTLIVRLINQLCGLERRTSRAGKDSITHAPGAHDDVANAAAGALTNPSEYPIQIFT